MDIKGGKNVQSVGDKDSQRSRQLAGDLVETTLSEVTEKRRDGTGGIKIIDQGREHNLAKEFAIDPMKLRGGVLSEESNIPPRKTESAAVGKEIKAAVEALPDDGSIAIFMKRADGRDDRGTIHSDVGGEENDVSIAFQCQLLRREIKLIAETRCMENARDAVMAESQRLAVSRGDPRVSAVDRCTFSLDPSAKSPEHGARKLLVARLAGLISLEENNRASAHRHVDSVYETKRRSDVQQGPVNVAPVRGTIERFCSRSPPRGL